jgi:glucosylceramidase
MKSIFLFLLFTACISLKAQTVSWISSTEKEAWKSQPALSLTKSKNIKDISFEIDTTNKEQSIDGFGGAFSELGWIALKSLPASEREKALRLLFDVNSGCAFNLGRVPIGASDFAQSWYSCNDSLYDYSMKYFSIARDKKNLIPYIASAAKINPALKVWGSPWSPPAWMKENKHYSCQGMNSFDNPLYGSCCEDFTGKAHLQFDEQTQKAYSKYLALFIKAYRSEGINLYALHVQNEPVACQMFPSCLWKGSELGSFIKNYLSPEFKSQNMEAEIWLGTINSGNFNEFAGTVLTDQATSSLITGVSYQWDGKAAVAETRQKFPLKKIMQSESECGNGRNLWSHAMYIYGQMKHYFDNGASSYMYWNMVLDQFAFSTWQWRQNSMLSIDTETKKVTMNPEYYIMKHFSAFVKPGSRKIKTISKETAVQEVSFVDPSGALIITLCNTGELPKEVNIKIGNKVLSPVLEAFSINTIGITGK